jgi:hypothetical protein
MNDRDIEIGTDSLFIRLPIPESLRARSVGNESVHLRLLDSEAKELEAHLRAFLTEGLCRRRHCDCEEIDGRRICACYMEIIPCDHGD